jgi:hypothetical protein
MSTDLHPNPRIEDRLRDAFDAVIPQLMDDLVEPGTWDRDLDGEREWDHDPAVEPRRRSGLLRIAAAVLLVGGGAAVWSASTRPEPATDPATAGSVDVSTVTSAASTPTEVESTVSSILTASTGSSVPCLVEDCTPVDRLSVVDGASDFYAGPESLGPPVVNQELLDQFGLVRCLELTSDGMACQRIEGLAAVDLVAYPSVGVEIGTTFTSISAADYAAKWGVSGAGVAPTEDVVVRGHPGVRFPYGERDLVVWPERDGVLVWVTAPSAMSDELLSIAEGIRTLDGPATIPYLVVTGLGSSWDASNNDAAGVVYARIGDALCLGIGWVPEPCSRIVTRQTPDGSEALQIAGAGPSGAATARVELDDGSSYDFALSDAAGITDGGVFLGEIPAVSDAFTLTWLTAGGAVLASESIDVTSDPEVVVATTSPAGSDDTTVVVANASNVNGAASAFTANIRGNYVTIGAVNALQMADRTVVYYSPGFESAARDLAGQVGGADVAPMPDLSTIVETQVLIGSSDGRRVANGPDVLVVVGNDHAIDFSFDGPALTTTTGG